jgi:hypothetical protein
MLKNGLQIFLSIFIYLSITFIVEITSKNINLICTLVNKIPFYEFYTMGIMVMVGEIFIYNKLLYSWEHIQRPLYISKKISRINKSA